jgi:hypothetical protein
MLQNQYKSAELSFLAALKAAREEIERLKRLEEEILKS